MMFFALIIMLQDRKPSSTVTFTSLTSMNFSGDRIPSTKHENVANRGGNSSVGVGVGVDVEMSWTTSPISFATCGTGRSSICATIRSKVDVDV